MESINQDHFPSCLIIDSDLIWDGETDISINEFISMHLEPMLSVMTKVAPYLIIFLKDNHVFSNIAHLGTLDFEAASLPDSHLTKHKLTYNVIGDLETTIHHCFVTAQKSQLAYLQSE